MKACTFGQNYILFLILVLSIEKKKSKNAKVSDFGVKFTDHLENNPTISKLWCVVINPLYMLYIKD